MQISLTVFRPTVISSGRARSCTNWLHKCRMTGCNQSGGTKSWHAYTDTLAVSDAHLAVQMCVLAPDVLSAGAQTE